MALPLVGFQPKESVHTLDLAATAIGLQTGRYSEVTLGLSCSYILSNGDVADNTEERTYKGTDEIT
jgi:hypothetical protein